MYTSTLKLKRYSIETLAFYLKKTNLATTQTFVHLTIYSLIHLMYFVKSTHVTFILHGFSNLRAIACPNTGLKTQKLPPPPPTPHPHAPQKGTSTANEDVTGHHVCCVLCSFWRRWSDGPSFTTPTLNYRRTKTRTETPTSFLVPTCRC